MPLEKWIYTLPLRLRSVFRRRRVDQELDDELRYHVERKTEGNLATGMTPQEARRSALLEMDGIEKRKEECRETRRVTWLQDLVRDLRYGVRTLRKSPGFTVAAVITLSLGIGANTAIFSVVNAILLRPLPIRAPGQVVVLHDQIPKLNLPRAGVSPLQFRDYSSHTNVFETTALLQEENLDLTAAGRPQRLLAMRASATLFPLLGIRPILGRSFSAAEDTYGNGRVVLLSEGFWKGIFGAAPNAIGKRLQLDDESYEVIGVLPEKLQILYPHIQLWIPMALSAGAFTEDERWTIVFTMLARLRSGATLEQARSVMAVDAARAIAGVPPEHRGILDGFRIEVRPLPEEEVGGVRQCLYLLLGAVVLVLLIACADVASLLLARGSTRSREMAVRAGSGRQPPSYHRAASHGKRSALDFRRCARPSACTMGNGCVHPFGAGEPTSP
jgi:predicted permease